MKSEQILFALYRKYLFEKNIDLIANEFGDFRADFFAYDRKKNVTHEIEIKTSLKDFKKDIEKDKHKIYKSAKNNICIPDYFWFCVPHKISNKVLDIINNTVEYEKYGLYEYVIRRTGTFGIEQKIYICKRAVNLRPFQLDKIDIQKLTFRMLTKNSYEVYNRIFNVIKSHVFTEFDEP